MPATNRKARQPTEGTHPRRGRGRTGEEGGGKSPDHASQRAPVQTPARNKREQASTP